MNLVRIVTLITVIGAICSCSKGKVKADTASGIAAEANPSTVHAASARIADPCKLLTQAEASEAVGAKLGAGELRHFGTVNRCAFYDPTKEEKLWLDVQNETAHVPDSQLFDSFAHGPDVKMISGIGDRAIWDHSQIGTFLYVLKGETMVAIGLPRTMATMTPAVEKAARLIAGRM